MYIYEKKRRRRTLADSASARIHINIYSRTNRRDVELGGALARAL